MSDTIEAADGLTFMFLPEDDTADKQFRPAVEAMKDYICQPPLNQFARQLSVYAGKFGSVHIRFTDITTHNSAVGGIGFKLIEPQDRMVNDVLNTFAQEVYRVVEELLALNRRSRYENI